MTSSLITAPAAPAAHRPLASVAHPAREAATFLGLVYAMVVGVALVLPPRAGFAPLISMVTPLVAVLLITFLRTPRGARRALWGTFGLRRAGLRSWPAAGVVGVTAVFVIPFGVATLLGSSRFVALSSIDVPDAVLNLVVALAIVTLLAMTEEIGWRSYLLPRVQALTTRRRAAVAVGVVHGLFHMPLILLTTTYDSVGSRWIVAPVVLLALTGAGVFYAWLKDRSGSVWPVAFAHAAVNVFIDGAGLIVIIAPIALAYTATESGLATLASIVGIAIVILIRGRTWGSVGATKP